MTAFFVELQIYNTSNLPAGTDVDHIFFMQFAKPHSIPPDTLVCLLHDMQIFCNCYMKFCMDFCSLLERSKQ